jgi:nucleotide-binding universal stress UspA family protein
MQSLRSVVILVEGKGPGEAVFRLVRSLAAGPWGRALNVTLVYVHEPIPWYARLVLARAPELEEALVQGAGARLEALAASLRGPGIAVRTCLLRGKPAIETVREVLRSGGDLIIKEVTRARDASYSSLDLHLLRLAPCPVWLLRAGDERAEPKCIVAAVDPMPARDEDDVLHLQIPEDRRRASLDERIVELALSVAQSENAVLHVVHAWSVPGEELLQSEPLLSPQQVHEYVEATKSAHEQGVARLLARHPGAIPPERVHVHKGSAAEVILEQVRALGADLIVMGTVVRTGLPGLLLGNTAETVLGQARCSVLAVKPEGFVSPVPHEAP